MYLQHFKLRELPFTLTPNTGFYCELSNHKEALNVLLLSLRSGEGFIKVVGEVGTGKTLLCRNLLNCLDDDIVTAYIPNPGLTARELHKALARELGLRPHENTDQHGLLELITARLMALHSNGKRVVLIIDEAQALSDECLETIRLLTNLETEVTKLLQVVLLGQPELDQRLQQSHLRQLRQRISFTTALKPLSRADLDTYLYHRLAMAGYTFGPLFTRKACDMLYKSSSGIPRLINILCHKSMMVTYGRGKQQVDHHAMLQAIFDTEGAIQPSGSRLQYWLFYSLTLLAGLAIGMKYYAFVLR